MKNLLEKENLKVQFPSQGWKQMLTAKKEMLDSYDSAREKARSHEIETFHGNVAEAVFRKWLSGFLPKRYGVTSGYVVSPGLSNDEKIPHFDVIIYDQLDSPILWIEDNPDSSEQGRSLAIPVEYVRLILEIKSSLSPRTVKDSLNHLADLSSLMNGVDDPEDRYKLHLSSTFRCGLVFFELRKEEAYSEAALSAVTKGYKLRGFLGGIILRAEQLTVPSSGRIFLYQSEESSESNLNSSFTSPLGVWNESIYKN